MKRKIIQILLSIVFITHAQSDVTKILIGGTAHIGNGEIIENSTIIIAGDKIQKIGQSDSITYKKENVQIFDLTGKHIYPSLILPNTTLGLAEIDAVRASRDDKEVGELNSNVRAQVAFNTESIVVSTVLTNGILIAQVTPRGGLIAGTSSIMKLSGKTWEDATYLQDDGLHINWPEEHRLNRWIHSHDFTADKKDSHNEKEDKEKESIIKLYDFFQKAKNYQQIDRKEKDLRLEALSEIFEGKQTLYLHAHTVNGIKDAITFAKNFEITKVVLVGGSESWRITNFILEHNVPIILERIHRLPNNEDDDIDQPYKTPKILKDAGILFCLDYQGDMERMGARNLPFTAGSTVNYGLSKEDALELITLNTAKILGISKQTGSLEHGKDANLFVSKGDILDIASHDVELIFLMGKQISLANHQNKLYQKYLHKKNK